MTWEETIQYIRTQPAYQDLVEKAYFEEDLPLNVRRFRESEEYAETIRLLKHHQPNAQTILDIGCGNGISAISFALEGYTVTAVEPDPSPTIGAGAIRQLQQHYQLQNIEVFEAFAENIQFEDNRFDIVYFRQAMHHANHLEKFLAEAARVLKKGGLLLAVRDHVVFDPQDKAWLLETHPLQKFYGGENAFSPQAYRNAMEQAGLVILKEYKHFESVLNFSPSTKEEIAQRLLQIKTQRKKHLKSKIGFLAGLPFVFTLYDTYLDKKVGKALDEMVVPGRMYSYMARKR